MGIFHLMFDILFSGDWTNRTAVGPLPWDEAMICPESPNQGFSGALFGGPIGFPLMVFRAVLGSDRVPLGVFSAVCFGLSGWQIGVMIQHF